MKLIKEPVDVDFIFESKPWSENQLNELRIVMKKARTDAEKKLKPKGYKLPLNHKTERHNRPNLAVK